MVTMNVILKIALIQSKWYELVHRRSPWNNQRVWMRLSQSCPLSTIRSLFINVGLSLLLELGALLLEDVQQSLRTLQDFVECTLRLLDRLVVLVPGRVLLRQRIIDGFKPISEWLHLFLDLSLFLLFLIDQVLDFFALLADSVHHFYQGSIRVSETLAWSHYFKINLLYLLLYKIYLIFC